MFVKLLRAWVQAQAGEHHDVEDLVQAAITPRATANLCGSPASDLTLPQAKLFLEPIQEDSRIHSLAPLVVESTIVWP